MKLADSERNTWVKSVVGSHPSIADAIAGRPKAMYAQQKEMSDRGAVTVWFNTVSSGGWDASDLAPRGAAVAALVLKLAETRPVELKMLAGIGQCSETPNVFIVVPFNVQTMNVSQIAHLTCSSGWHRSTYQMTVDYDNSAFKCNGSWDGLFNHHGRDVNDPKYIRDVKRFLGAAEGDLYIPQAFLRDEMVKNPVAWVERTLAQFQSMQDDEWRDAA